MKTARAEPVEKKIYKASKLLKYLASSKFLSALLKVWCLLFWLIAKGDMGLEMTRSHLTPYSPLATKS
jgi:hypothetical protein